MQPGYIDLHRQGILSERRDRAVARLSCCTLCPRTCAVDRTLGGLGFCKTGRNAHVASYNLHFGEEAPLVGDQGSGTIFFAGCNLGCMFCQNDDISRDTAFSDEVDPQQLADIMLELQTMGALNINLVTPSHVIASILEALPLAVDRGLKLPLIYNSSGYDKPSTLELLDGVMDIYMPDVKFSDPDTAFELVHASDYPQVARKALVVMHHQVGDLVMDEQGIAIRGLLVRHLVLPDGLAGTEDWMAFLSNSISRETYLNIMDQYRPCGGATNHPSLYRPITLQEYEHALHAASSHGLNRLDSKQESLTRALHHLFKM